MDAAQASRDAALSLWDWRRRIFDLYGAVRAAPGPEGWAYWRATRDELFRTHAQTPLETDQLAVFAGVPLYPYDPGLRFTVKVKPATDRAPRPVEAGRDGTMTLTAFAMTEGLAERLGAELTLFWIGGYGGGVFLPIRDATSGRETYGGGRYLLDTIKGADLGQERDGRLILDFNFAYNPSCAYSDLWVCPLAPPENVLPVPIRGGERRAG
ncbi:MAG: DUF1684 domain-containing protein [Methylobacteriaceae bacterium]|nr:DUF1684 domain-containing protein [Methylobacteriaceae bacterium]